LCLFNIFGEREMAKQILLLPTFFSAKLLRQIKKPMGPTFFSSSLLCGEKGKRNNFLMLFPLYPCLLPSFFNTFKLSFFYLLNTHCICWTQSNSAIPVQRWICVYGERYCNEGDAIGSSVSSFVWWVTN